MSALALEVDRVTRRFGSVVAVDGLSFQLEKGKVCGFVGPNGAGKTTTMRILATLELPDEGDARVRGLSVLEEPRGVRRAVGFMADQFVPYPNLSVRELLDFFALAHGLRGRKRLETIDAVATFCGLADLLGRPATGLSKGMGQRLHLAKTLLHDPDVLVLDEPTAGLDPRARVEFRELVRELASRGKTILCSSHILSELGEICDEVLVIERGRRIVSGGIRTIARELQSRLAVRARVLRDGDAAERFFAVQAGVDRLVRSDASLTFEFSGDDAALSELLERAAAASLGLVEFRVLEASLEEIFLRSTKGVVQ